MDTETNLMTTSVDYQAIITNELGNFVKHRILNYIAVRYTLKMVSEIERELIAEASWFHVVENSMKYKAGKAKFRTWALKVAVNFAKTELKKLKNDPLHGGRRNVFEEQPDDKDEAADQAQKTTPNVFPNVSDCIEHLYWKDALGTLKHIVQTYSDRDQSLAEMLIAQKTKEEIMSAMHMSGGNVDVCKCRLLKKMRTDLLRAGYSLAA